VTETTQEIDQLKLQLKQREAELAILTEVQLRMADRLEVQAIYDLVGDRIRDIFDPDVVMLSTYDSVTNTVEHRYAIELGERIYAPGHVPPGGFRSYIIEKKSPIMVNTGVAELAAKLNQPTIAGTVTPKSWLGVPMMVGDQVTGILSLQSVTEENAFTDSDVRLMETLAASMSVALENARLWEQEHLYRQALEREFAIGRDIQSGFLPETIPQPEGWEIAVFIKPAREVAGDFYDVFSLPGGEIGLIVADVCDKGLGAALFMTLVRSLLRAVSNLDFYTRREKDTRRNCEERLRQAIRFTNNYIEENHGKTGMFATVFFGLLDPTNGHLNYVNCGHMPPLVVDTSRNVRALNLTGPAVGAIRDPDFVVLEDTLQPGELLFSYTDGLTDAENVDGENFSPARLLPLLKSGEVPSKLLESIRAHLKEFTIGAGQFDDIAMLAVKRTGQS
jgi:sigma-B regulation protein RsbU (phosphoserine phosphatase)